MRLNSKHCSTAVGLGAIVLWSTTVALARSLSERVGPLSGGAAVYLIAGVFCLLPWARSEHRFSRLLKLPRTYLLGCGALFLFYPAALYLAIGLATSREQVLEIGLVNYLWPALTILFSLPILKKRAQVWLIPGTALALAGVLLVMTQGAELSWRSFSNHLRGNPAAYALAATAAIAWGLYSNLARRWSGPGCGGAVELFIPATGLLLLGLRFGTSEATNWSLVALLEASALAAITVLSYGLWDQAMRKGNLLLVAACSYFTPLLSTVVSCAYLRVSPGPKLWVGCALLVSGSLITWFSVSEDVASPELMACDASRRL